MSGVATLLAFATAGQAVVLPERAAATCTQDACLKLFELFDVVAKPFCSAYTQAPTHTVHPIAARWAKAPAKISSACTCLNGETAPAATPTPTSSKAVVSSVTLTSSSQPSATSTATPTDACYVTAYSAIPKAVTACTSITLDGITVPGNSTIDLSKLKTGTKVTFKGTTFWEYFDANYPFIKVGGTNIEVTAAEGAVLDGNGGAWWDGLGSNGGVAK
jgi:polygalacturonase